MRIGGSIICGTKDSLTSAETGSGGALVGSSGRQVLSQRNCFVRCPTTCSRVSRRTSSTTHPLLILKSNRIFKKKCDGMDQMCHTGNRTSVHKENLHLMVTALILRAGCGFHRQSFHNYIDELRVQNDLLRPLTTRWSKKSAKKRPACE